jgi:hypothetical protein
VPRASIFVQLFAGHYTSLFPVLFPVCSRSRRTRSADNRPCSQCSGFSKPSLKWGAREFTSLFINVEQWEQWEHQEESTTYRRDRLGTAVEHMELNTPGVKQRSNALSRRNTPLMGHAHHECFHLWRRPVAFPKTEVTQPYTVTFDDVTFSKAAVRRVRTSPMVSARSSILTYGDAKTAVFLCNQLL